MISTQNQEPRLAFRIQWARTFGTWQVAPAQVSVTPEEFLGCPEEEIGVEPVAVHAQRFALPEVEPDEFERVFQWFLS